jgi:hypothetical protein
MADPTVLYDLASAVLDIAVAAIDNPPTRQLVSWGPPAWDCEEVCAWWGRTVASGFPLNQSSIRPQEKRGVVPVADILVGVVRCVPAIEGRRTPTPADLSASAAVLSTDAEKLRHALAVAVKTQALVGGCRTVSYLEVAPNPPAGAYAGVTAGLSIMLG